MGITKQTFRDGPFKEFFAEGVRVGDALYLAGQVGMDQAGNTPDTLTGQLKVAYANIERVLAEFGATMDNVVDETYFVTSVPEFNAELAELGPARQAVYGKPPEVSQTLVQVSALYQPEWKIEIKCIAHV